MRFFKTRKKDSANKSAFSVVESDTESNSGHSRSESAFALDSTEEFLEEQQKISDEHRRIMAKVKIPEVQYGKVQDVLEFLQIPFTFVLPENVATADSLKLHKFDLQAPYGYDQGQVDHLFKIVIRSFDHLVNLLDQRNEHVVELASVVDKLQVENHNLKLESEIADGVSIMATSDHELESKLMESQHRAEQLTRRVRELEEVTDETRSSELRLKVQDLEDELNLSARTIEEQNETIRDLKVRLGSAEELLDSVQSNSIGRPENGRSSTDAATVAAAAFSSSQVDDLYEPDRLTAEELDEPFDLSSTTDEKPLLLPEDFDLPSVDKVEVEPLSQPEMPESAVSSFYEIDTRSIDEQIIEWTEEEE